MTSLDELIDTVSATPSTEAAVERLVLDLAARIKATSNDQNIQRLSRDLSREATNLARLIAGKDRVSAG